MSETLLNSLVHAYLAEMIDLLQDVLKPVGHIGIVPKEVFKVRGKDTFVYEKPENGKLIKCSAAQKELLKKGKLQACKGPWCQAFQDEEGKLLLREGSRHLPEIFTFDDEYFAQKDDFKDYFKESGLWSKKTIKNALPTQWEAES